MSEEDDGLFMVINFRVDSFLGDMLDSVSTTLRSIFWKDCKGRRLIYVPLRLKSVHVNCFN